MVLKGVSISYRLLCEGATTGFCCQWNTKDKSFAFAKAAKDFFDTTNYTTENLEFLNIDRNTIIAI